LTSHQTLYQQKVLAEDLSYIDDRNKYIRGLYQGKGDRYKVVDEVPSTNTNFKTRETTSKNYNDMLTNRERKYKGFINVDELTVKTRSGKDVKR